jgi:hypothetical protein
LLSDKSKSDAELRKKKDGTREKIKDKKNCASLCRYKCLTKIDRQQRKSLFDSYYQLDQNGKYPFINKTTEKVLTSRPKNKDRDQESSRAAVGNLLAGKGHIVTKRNKGGPHLFILLLIGMYLYR